MHTNMLTLNGKRMSKSTGNSILPRELFTGNNDLMQKPFDPIVVRFFMMQAHYRSTLDFSSEALTAAEKGFDKLMQSIGMIDDLPVSDRSSRDLDAIINKWYAAMDDDFNSPVLIAELFEGTKWIRAIDAGKDAISSEDKEKLSSTMKQFVYDVLGLSETGEATESSTNDDTLQNELMRLILDLRQDAKANGNFSTADQIRDKLNELNITIQDSKVGSTWKKD